MNTPTQTVIGLFVATDERNWDEVESSFHDKVLLDYSSMNGNPASETGPIDISADWKGILPGFESTHHQLGNFIERIDSDTAHVFCYGTASHYLSDDEGSIWVVVGTYDFELIQEGDKWVITSMTFKFKYMDGNSSLPEKAIKNLEK